MQPGTSTVCVVTCYRQPDYVRALTLRQALRDGDDFDRVVTVKNARRGPLRYPEVVWKLVGQRLTDPPDAYLVTFRGYEILPLVLLVAAGRPVVYDEFINPVEWFVEEHHRFPVGSVRARVLRTAMRGLMRRTRCILADTSSHLRHSAQLMDLDPRRYRAVPVSTDEEHFRRLPAHRGSGRFTVLYYGSMLPLHGLEHVLEAALALKDTPDITFRLIGGGADAGRRVALAGRAGASVHHERWVDYAELPQVFMGSDLFLAGPFGATVQSRFVITGKTYQFLAAGLPTMVGANEETGVFTHRVDALVVPRGDAVAIAREIRWAAANRTELALIGRRGRELYDERFSQRIVAQRLEGIFGTAPTPTGWPSTPGGGRSRADSQS